MGESEISHINICFHIGTVAQIFTCLLLLEIHFYIHIKMDQDKYTLHWHTYSDHLRNILREMTSDDSFADVTLVTDDKKQLKAHRNILSACSSVFKEILQIKTNNNHPVIYLRGIQYPEMESILQFIYLGEAKFYEERIKEFLTVAKNLEIREVAKGIEDGDSTETETEESQIEADDVAEPGKQEVDEATEGHHKTHSKTVTKGYKYECLQCDKAYKWNSHLKTHIQSVHEGVKYACNQCDYEATQQQNLTRHIQILHEGVKHACNQCDKQFTDQGNLSKHIQSVHKGVKYACNQCDQQLTTQQSLTQHKQSKHEGIKYSCHLCDQQFSRQTRLTQHIKSAHEQ